jgi:hypothetical protein
MTPETAKREMILRRLPSIFCGFIIAILKSKLFSNRLMSFGVGTLEYARNLKIRVRKVVLSHLLLEKIRFDY